MQQGYSTPPREAVEQATNQVINMMQEWVIPNWKIISITVLIVYLVIYLLRKIPTKIKLVGQCWNCGEKFPLSRRQYTVGWKCPTAGCHQFNRGEDSLGNKTLQKAVLQFSLYSFVILEMGR